MLPVFQPYQCSIDASVDFAKSRRFAFSMSARVREWLSPS